MSIKGGLNKTKRLDYVNKLTKCHNHPTEEVKYLCKDHNQLCCNECAIVTHRKCQSLLSITDSIASGFPKCVREDMEKIEKHAEGLQMHGLNNIQRLEESERTVKSQLIRLKLKFDNDFRNFEEKVLKTIKIKCNGLRSSVHTQQFGIEKLQTNLKRSKEKIASIEQFGQDLHFYLMEREMKNEMAQHEQVLKSLHQEANCTEISLAGINYINGQLIKCLEKNLTVNEIESNSALPQLPDFKLQEKPFLFGNRRSPNRPNSNNGYGGRMGYWQ
ncbi:tripartite motif-containing protein 45-like [Mercenaria mercenaria]|uniref:tripartite motif-containing protein 45-like n=1 Tax=Mercenaria mercenaria TaxID=6596 RepID=UPI00234F8B87|nr:tripartite motif-containing protein 45-like [Mercenaria mercenaria]